MLDYRILTFLNVYETLNFTISANKLHITQPAVSQHIAYLEDYYQVQLFIRDGKKIKPTPAGSQLYRAMKTIQSDEIKLLDNLIKDENKLNQLRIGVTMTIGEFTITNALAKLIKNNPTMHIKLTFDNTSNLLKDLENGNIDIAISEGYYNNDNFTCITYRKEPYILVANTNHQFLSSPLNVKDICKESLIIREEGSGSRSLLENYLSLRNLSLNNFKRLIEVGSISTIVKLMLQDCGIGFVYHCAVEKELNNGLLRHIKLHDFELSHDFVFLFNKGSIYTNEYQKICQQIIDLT